MGAAVSGAIPAWAFVGAKVVCIDADLHGGPGWPPLAPVEGATYVIVRHGPISISGNWQIEVATEDGRQVNAGHAFWGKRFRPLITQEDDIATHFSALLDVREPVGA